MVGILYQEEMEIVMLKSTHSCYAKTLLIEEGHANCSVTHWWSIAQILGSLILFSHLTIDTRL